MTEEEITTEMKVLDLQLKDLEKKGVKLEEVLREDMELGMSSSSDSLCASALGCQRKFSLCSTGRS